MLGFGNAATAPALVATQDNRSSLNFTTLGKAPSVRKGVNKLLFDLTAREARTRLTKGGKPRGSNDAMKIYDTIITARNEVRATAFFVDKDDLRLSTFGRRESVKQTNRDKRRINALLSTVLAVYYIKHPGDPLVPRWDEDGKTIAGIAFPSSRQEIDDEADRLKRIADARAEQGKFLAVSRHALPAGHYALEGNG